MKKRIIASGIFFLLAGLGMAGWYSYAKSKYDAIEYAPEPASIYEVGPPTPQEMLELVNKERAEVGVAPLLVAENIQKSAQLKADDFATRNYYNHHILGTDRMLTQEMSKLVYPFCSKLGENIAALGYTSYNMVSEGWMESAPHKAAILDPAYTHTGFGVSQDANDSYYAVQHFCVAA